MIPVVVLAAGLSTRMGGRPKALLRLPDGRTFVQAIVDTYLDAEVRDIVVVLGHEATAVAEHLARTRGTARVVVNAAYHTGQFSSVLAGLDAVDRPGVEAMLMTLVDVPLVSADTVRHVVQRFHCTAAPIVRPVRGDEHGHPVLVSRALFSPLRHANASEGAKPIVRAHASAAGDVVVEDAHAFRDVDTPEEYAGILNPSQ
ncbi:MAG: nucleotidyltransferase family protein [Vicinamibacterales bacterium]